MMRLDKSGLTPYFLRRRFSASVAALTPTHSIPEYGLPIRRKPDPNEKPFGRLPGGQEVHIEIQVGAWARLVGSEEMLPANGRPRGWVDAQRLTEVPDDLLKIVPRRPMDTASPHPLHPQVWTPTSAHRLRPNIVGASRTTLATLTVMVS